jgi:hypothetical protein
MGSGFDDWIYWHSLTIILSYDRSQSMTVYVRSIPCWIASVFAFTVTHGERRNPAHTLNSLIDVLTNVLCRMSRDWNLLDRTNFHEARIAITMSYSSCYSLFQPLPRNVRQSRGNALISPSVFVPRNVCQSRGNALIYTSVSVATKCAFCEPLSSNGLFRHGIFYSTI